MAFFEGNKMTGGYGDGPDIINSCTINANKGEIVADGTNEELMSGFMGNTKLTLEVKNAEDDSIKGLTEKIPSLSLLDAEVKNGSQLLQLEYPKDQDPREALFKYAVDSNWVVTEMSPHSANLESIFDLYFFCLLIF